MAKVEQPLTQISSGGVGATTTVKLDIGRSYHQVFIKHENVTAAEITNIRLVINGVTAKVWRSGTELNTFNLFKRIPALADHMVFDFERTGVLAKEVRESSAIGTGRSAEGSEGVATAHILFDIAAVIAAAPAVPAISGYTVTSGPQLLGVIEKVVQYNAAPAAAGAFEVSDIPRASAIVSIAVDMSAVAVNNFELLVNNSAVINTTPAIVNHRATAGIRTPQADWFIYDTAADGYGGDFINVANASNVRFKFDVDGAGQLPFTVTYLAGLRG